MNKDITLIVMAAGMGSRFGGLKQIAPIGKNGEILLDYSVYDAVKAGFNKVVFVIKHAIEQDFKAVTAKHIEKMVKTEYVFQETDELPEGFTCPADRTKPWAMVECSTLATSALRSHKSSIYLARPVALSYASTRITLFPTLLLIRHTFLLKTFPSH